MLTKDVIINLLKTDDRAIARALLVLTERQTYDEQAGEQTRHLNGRGYRPAHARMGTSMSKFFERFGYLSPKQIAYWRRLDKTGSMRIGIYWKQLAEAAEQKKAQKMAAAPIALKVIARDFGNDMERKMVLEEELGMAIDSDDPALTKPIEQEIDEIDAFWKAIQEKEGR